jgi:hypothetical protein
MQSSRYIWRKKELLHVGWVMKLAGPPMTSREPTRIRSPRLLSVLCHCGCSLVPPWSLDNRLSSDLELSNSGGKRHSSPPPPQRKTVNTCFHALFSNCGAPLGASLFSFCLFILDSNPPSLSGPLRKWVCWKEWWWKWMQPLWPALDLPSGCNHMHRFN